MGVQILCGIHSQILAQSHVSEIATISRQNLPRSGAVERVSDRRRAFVRGSCTHVDLDSAEVFSVASDGMHQR